MEQRDLVTLDVQDLGRLLAVLGECMRAEKDLQAQTEYHIVKQEMCKRYGNPSGLIYPYRWVPFDGYSHSYHDHRHGPSL